MNIKIIFIILFIFYSTLINASEKLEHFHFSANDLKHAETALYLADKEKWQEALYVANIMRDDIIKKIVLWTKYKSSPQNYNFLEITDFIKKNSNWPNINLLIQNAENSINNNTNQESVRNWFKSYPPTISNGYRYFALTYDKEQKNQIVKQGWIKGSFCEEDESEYYNKFINILDHTDHVERIDELLLQGRIPQAKRMISRLNKPYQILFNTRINLIQNNQLSDLSKIPSNLRKNHGLIYELLNYYDSKGNNEAVREILKDYSPSNKYADKGWKIRVKQIREMLGEKKYSLAYNISKVHGSKDSTNYAEGEWLSGWIALTFLGKRDAAYGHFYNLYKNVKAPISKARAAYWLGRALETNDPQAAKTWYKKAAIYPETFYGQLAISALGVKSLTLPHKPNITSIDLSKYKNNQLIKAAFIFIKLQKPELACAFLKTAIESAKTPGEITLISEFASNVNNMPLSIKITKEAIRKGILLHKSGYPNTRYISKINRLEKSLALAIIRQESLFYEYAESKAGALGLMQLMPATAKELSKEININFSLKGLKSNPEYNVKLGSYYLEKLIDYFGGSYILAIAAYNAGINNVARWIVEYGDPREYKDIKDVINWMESIPFYETRSYVQRVIENLQIYRLIVNSKLNSTLNIEEDLRR